MLFLIIELSELEGEVQKVFQHGIKENLLKLRKNVRVKIRLFSNLLRKRISI